MAEPAIIVFARALEPGRVKTRLIPALGEQGALAVYSRLLDHTLEMVRACAVPVYLYGTHADASLTDRAARHRISFERQQGAGLGQRMARALSAEHARGHERLLLVGSDCPVLSVKYLREALEKLAQSDFVLGPAEDGGYVLIGSRAMATWADDPLSTVRFGGDRALEDTRHALATHGRVQLLEPLWDLDEPGDWRRARAAGLLD